MRTIDIIKKCSVHDVCVDGIYPTNLIAYNVRLEVDDSGVEKTAFILSLYENNRKVGFSDDFRDFKTRRHTLEYIEIDCNTKAHFVKQYYDKFNLNDCLLRIETDKGVYTQYDANVSFNDTYVKLTRKGH